MSNNEHLVITMPDGTKVEIGGDHLPVTTGFPENLPKLYLNPEKGSKLDIIRIYYVISELNLIVDESGRKAKKKDIFQVLGYSFNTDFSNYSSDLSSSLADGSSMKKHLRIFEDMVEKMKSIFNLR